MRCFRCFVFVLVLTPLFAGTRLTAAPPLEQLLPDSTQAVLMTANGADLIRAFEVTQFGRLACDESLRPFLIDLERECVRAQTTIHELGLTWEDFKSMASGPAALAIVKSRPDQVAVVALVDTAGRSKERLSSIGKVGHHVKSQRGELKAKMIRDIAVTEMNLPARHGSKPLTIYELTKDDLLLLTDQESALQAILDRWAKGSNSLLNLPAYQEVRKRTRFPDGKPASFSWFVDAGIVVTAASATDTPSKKNRKDAWAILHEECLAGLKAMGGAARLDDGPWEAHVRMAICAPGPLGNAMQMMNFPNQPQSRFAPEPWVPKDAVSYWSFSWDMKDFLTSFGIVFDRITGKKGNLEAIIKDYKDAPVDLRRDIFGRLTGQVSLISDCPETYAKRTLIAFQAREEPQLAQSIARMMEIEEDVKPRKFQGQTIWEITVKPRETRDGKPVQLPKMALAVANGNLFFTNNVLLMEKVLGTGTPVEPLAKATDYLQLQQDLDKLGVKMSSFRMFSRPAELLRGPYELTRTNRLAQSENISSKLLRNWLVDPVRIGPTIKLNPAILPPYDKIQHHLQPFGAIAVTRPDGWDVIGIALKSGAPVKNP